MYVSKSFSISSRLSSLLAYIVHSSLLGFFVFLLCQLVKSSFLFIILLIWVLIFFPLVSLARFVSFIYRFKEPTLGLVNLFFCFPIFYFIYSVLIFIISILQLTLGSVSSSYCSPWGVELSYLFKNCFSLFFYWSIVDLQCVSGVQ